MAGKWLAGHLQMMRNDTWWCVKNAQIVWKRMIWAFFHVLRNNVHVWKLYENKFMGGNSQWKPSEFVVFPRDKWCICSSGEEKSRFSYYFYWLLEFDGVIYVCRWSFVAVGFLQCAIEIKFKYEIIVINNNYPLNIHLIKGLRLLCVL